MSFTTNKHRILPCLYLVTKKLIWQWENKSLRVYLQIVLFFYVQQTTISTVKSPVCSYLPNYLAGNSSNYIFKTWQFASKVTIQILLNSFIVYQCWRLIWKHRARSSACQPLAALACQCLTCTWSSPTAVCHNSHWEALTCLAGHAGKRSVAHKRCWRANVFGKPDAWWMNTGILDGYLLNSSW